MAKNKSEKCPYLSNYGGGYVRPDQWITEKLCSVVAKKGSIELPDRFWRDSQWSMFFRRQVALAAVLLQDFKAEAVVAALRDKKLYHLRSFLGFGLVPRFHKILIDNQNRCIVEESAEEVKLDIVGTTSLPTFPKRTNLLSRLNSIDGKSKKR